MKSQLSALEIGYLVKEFAYLENARVDSIFHPEKEELLILFYVQGKGKRILRILPNFIYLADEKRSSETPSGICMKLRKHLLSARLRKIKQIPSERIVELLFENKEGKYLLIIELFGKGNIIFCKENYEIIAILNSHIWKDRELKLKAKYELPPKRISFLDLSEDELKKALNAKKPIVKILASDFGLGGTIAEEICILSEIDKNKKIIDDKEVKKIVSVVKELINNKTKASVVYENDEICDIIPFDLKIYENLQKKSFDDYNSAIKFVLSKELKSSLDNEKTKVYNDKIKKIENVIKKQKGKIEKFKKDIEDNEKKAELIYKNYKLIEDIIQTINTALKKHSWKEISEKLKGHKIVKEVNSKDKKVVIELD